MRVFLSYHFPDEHFVRLVNYYLRRQPGLDTFFYGDDWRAEHWGDQVKREITSSDAIILFVGRGLGRTQNSEAMLTASHHHRLVILIGETTAHHDLEPHISGIPTLKFEPAEAAALECAQAVTGGLGLRWLPIEDLPIGYPFDYEKAITEEYIKGRGTLSAERIDAGCPPTWPQVVQDPPQHSNPVPPETIGSYRDENAHIVVDGRSVVLSEADAGSPVPTALTFPEAGPRAQLRYPLTPQSLKVGILVSGGIAPGINAVIAGIVQRHLLYAGQHEQAHRERGYDYEKHLTIYGYLNGFEALLSKGAHYQILDATRVADRSHLGGSMLGTSRTEELVDFENPRARIGHLRSVASRLTNDGVQILYVIGGDGSMRAAHALWKLARDEGHDLSVVGVPKTMDNDILWVWQAFGFLSAVERGREIIQQLNTETTSNPRLCIIQLFGSDSGFVASHAAWSSAVCDAVLIPEIRFTMAALSRYILTKLQRRYQRRVDGQSPHGMIVMAETALPTDVEQYLDDHIVSEREKQAVAHFIAHGRRVSGQTPDELRSASLKIVSQVLQRDIRQLAQYDPYWKKFRVFTNEPRHLLRAIPPSAADVVFGHRLGSLAVDNAMAGYTDFMISQWLTEYVLVPLKLVVLGRKRVPENGIFWKSVLASTRQPASME